MGHNVGLEQRNGNAAFVMKDLLHFHIDLTTLTAIKLGTALQQQLDETQHSLSEAQEEIRKLRIGGRRALDQLRDYEHKLKEATNAVSVATSPEDAPYQASDLAAMPANDERVDQLERELDALRSQLATREQTITPPQANVAAHLPPRAGQALTVGSIRLR